MLIQLCPAGRLWMRGCSVTEYIVISHAVFIFTVHFAVYLKFCVWPMVNSRWFAPPQVTVGSPMKVAVMLSQLPQFESGTILLAHVSLLMYFLISLPLYSFKAVMITTDLLNEFSSWKEFECLRCFVVVFALPLHHSPKYEADFCWWCRGQKETCCLITQPRRGSSFSTNWFLLTWCICRMWSLSSRPLQSMSPNLASGEGLSGLEIRACGKVWHETMELKVFTFLQFCFPLHSEMDSSTVDVQHFSSGSLW